MVEVNEGHGGERCSWKRLDHSGTYDRKIPFILQAKSSHLSGNGIADSWISAGNLIFPLQKVHYRSWEYWIFSILKRSGDTAKLLMKHSNTKTQPKMKNTKKHCQSYEARLEENAARFMIVQWVEKSAVLSLAPSTKGKNNLYGIMCHTTKQKRGFIFSNFEKQPWGRQHTRSSGNSPTTLLCLTRKADSCESPASYHILGTPLRWRLNGLGVTKWLDENKFTFKSFANFPESQ